MLAIASVSAPADVDAAPLVDDVVDGVKACRGITVDWDRWLSRPKAMGWIAVRQAKTPMGRSATFRRRGSVMMATSIRVPLGAGRFGPLENRCEVVTGYATAIAADRAVAALRRFAPAKAGRSSSDLGGGERLTFGSQAYAGKSVVISTQVWRDGLLLKDGSRLQTPR